MGAAEERLYRASEFAALTGVTVRTLHHYDRAGLLRPTRRTEAGYRLYGARDLARRGTPEVLERGQRDWQQLISEVQAAVAEGVDPASERAQLLAARWEGLIEQFTGGDPGIRENLRRLYADQANWPATFQQPYPDDVGAFIRKAKEAGEEK